MANEAVRGMLQAINEEDDDVARLAYSDWLEEHGDAAQAEFIRLQLQNDALPYEHPERRQEEAMLHEHFGRWYPDIPRHMTMFRKGFIHAILAEAHDFSEYAETDLHSALNALPVFPRALKLSGEFERNYELASFLEAPWAQKIRTLDVSTCGLHKGAIDALSETSSPPLLRSLNLNHCEIPPVYLHILLRSQALQRIRTWNLLGNHCTPETFNLLSRPAFASNLEGLSLASSHGTITDQRVLSILHNTRSDTFRMLEIWNAPVTDGLTRELDESGRLAMLDTLSLRGTAVSSDTVHLLAGGSDKRLRNLDLSDTHSNLHDLEVLLNSPRLSKLKCLDFQLNRLQDAQQETWEPESLVRLDHLSITGEYRSSIHHSVITSLRSCPSVHSASRLELDLRSVPQRTVNSFLRDPHFKALGHLDVHASIVHAEFIRALFSSRLLGQLRFLQSSGADFDAVFSLPEARKNLPKSLQKLPVPDLYSALSHRYGLTFSNSSEDRVHYP